MVAHYFSSDLELLAAQQIKSARDHDGVTWEEVGQAFDTTAQSAHTRFAHR